MRINWTGATPEAGGHITAFLRGGLKRQHISRSFFSGFLRLFEISFSPSSPPFLPPHRTLPSYGIKPSSARFPPPARRRPAAIMPNGPIIIDRAQMPLDSPPAEVEIIASSSPPVAPQPSTAMQTDCDGASDGGEGDPDEFRTLTDEELRFKIKRLRSSLHLLPDGGEKSRKLILRVEKELDRRLVAGPRKVSIMWALHNRFTGIFSKLRAFAPI